MVAKRIAVASSEPSEADSWSRDRVLGESESWIFAFGMRYSAGEFTLPATDAPCYINQYGRGFRELGHMCIHAGWRKNGQTCSA